MPSPIGHTLAGLTLGWLAEPDMPGRHRWLRDATTPFVLWCASMAAIPDADLLIPHFHRTATHSLTATALVLIITVAVTGKVTGTPNWRLAVALAAAHSSHLLMDWLGFDRNPPPGIQLFWPFDPTYYVSGWEWFPPTAREALNMRMVTVNAYAATFEMLTIGPLAIAAWAVRCRRRRRQA
jgi:membrane-bound metal-dependent hydrolase YbcI (DUF457 family)